MCCNLSPANQSSITSLESSRLGLKTVFVTGLYSARYGLSYYMGLQNPRHLCPLFDCSLQILIDFGCAAHKMNGFFSAFSCPHLCTSLLMFFRSNIVELFWTKVFGDLRLCKKICFLIFADFTPHSLHLTSCDSNSGFCLRWLSQSSDHKSVNFDYLDFLDFSMHFGHLYFRSKYFWLSGAPFFTLFCSWDSRKEWLKAVKVKHWLLGGQAVVFSCFQVWEKCTSDLPCLCPCFKCRKFEPRNLQGLACKLEHSMKARHLFLF